MATTNSSSTSNKKSSGFTFKLLNQFANETIPALVQKAIAKLIIPKFLYGTVSNVTEGGNFADVILTYGSQPTTVAHLSNKTNVILKVGDVCLLLCPHGNLTDLSIITNTNPTPTFAAENVVGTLTIGGQNANIDGAIVLKDTGIDETAIIMQDHSISFYDYQDTVLKVGELTSSRPLDSKQTPIGAPMIRINAEPSCSATISVTDSTNTTNGGISNVFEVSNNAHSDGITTYMYRNIDHKMCNITNVGNITATNVNGGAATFSSLQVSGAKNCVQSTKNFGDKLFYTNESTESWLDETMFGKITDGKFFGFIDPMVRESINTNMVYGIMFHPLEDCKFKITETTPTYFTITADKDVEFMCILHGKRRGLEHVRLEDSDNMFDRVDVKLNDNEAFDIMDSAIKKYDVNVNLIVNYMLKNMNS